MKYIGWRKITEMVSLPQRKPVQEHSAISYGSDGGVPVDWKLGNVVPFFKKGKK